MKLSVIFIALYTAIFTINCSPIYSVSYDYDRNIDFVNLRTYSWLPIAEEAKINTLDMERIKNSVNAELYKKGLKRATLNPDFKIAQHLGSKDKIQVTNWGYDYDPYPYYWRGYRGVGRSTVFQYEEGILILDFVNPKSNSLIWRGEAKGLLSGATTPHKRDKLIREAVQKILQNFPPPSE